MILNNYAIKSDILGALASGLCLVHCMATPFLFIAQSTTVVRSCHDTSPAWWSAIDFVFVGITYFAVRQSGINSSKPWMKFALYTAWALLSLAVFNEKFHFIELSTWWKYSLAFGLISLHLYNLKFCRCNGDSCCVS